jgi:hypothetical protein
MPHHGGYDNWDSALPGGTASPGGTAPQGGFGNYELWDQVHSPTRWWVGMDYVGMWVRGSRVPALVTTNDVSPGQATAGELPGARVLFGNDEVDTDVRSGGELRLGWWMVDGQFVGLEGHYMALQSETTRFTAAAAPGGQILARPYTDAVNGDQDALLVAFPGFMQGMNTFDLSGTVNVASESDLQSAGLLMRQVLWADFERNIRVDLIGGYRFLRLDESLFIQSSSFHTDPGAGDILEVRSDLFDTKNDLHGGEVGLTAELHRGRFTFDVMGKVGLMNNHEVVTIDGRFDTTTAGVTGTNPGGLLALPTNLGKCTRDQFAVLPEGYARLHFHLLDNLRMTVGYRVMFLNEAVRPGDQIDRSLNITQAGGGTLVGTPRPRQTFESTSLWMQGITAGIEWRY